MANDDRAKITKIGMLSMAMKAVNGMAPTQNSVTIAAVNKGVTTAATMRGVSLDEVSLDEIKGIFPPGILMETSCIIFPNQQVFSVEKRSPGNKLPMPISSARIVGGAYELTELPPPMG
jgi:hypothetical protein